MSVPAILLLIGFWFTGTQSPPARTPPETRPPRLVRVHHLHFRVRDPAPMMRAYAGRLEGTPVVLEHLGIGVRIGDHFVLFDRDEQRTESRPAAGVEAVYDAAVAWLSAHGVSVPPGELATLPLQSLRDPLTLDHVAFSSGDYPGVVDAIAAGGAPLRRTNDAAMFGLPDGARVEIVRDIDAPDAYWCPMHPEVRSSALVKCPLCTMPLVPMPPPRVSEYRMDIRVDSGAGGRGLGGLRIVIRDPERGAPVSELSTIHERLLHVFLVGRNLEYFAHVHPSAAGRGLFRLTHVAPEGEYVVIADFLPKRGTSQMLHRAIVTAGHHGFSFAAIPALKPDIADTHATIGGPGAGPGRPRWGSAEQTIDGVRIRLEAADLIAGRRALLRFTLFDAAAGTPIDDLEPFLGAPGHMLIVNTALTDAVHGHPEPQDARTSVVTFRPQMPAASICKLWVQFQRQGRVITAPFVIEVAEP